MTPLTKWNPYNITYHKHGDFDWTKGGSCTSGDEYKGWTDRVSYFTPSQFFNGISESTDADTSNNNKCVLDNNGNSHSVMASGHWITFPKIPSVGYVRQR